MHAVAYRLRAIQAELGLSNEEMSTYVGGSSGAVWGNWVNELNMPEEAAMVRLCDWGVTLDWIYRGNIEGIKIGKAIRLIARLKGIDPDQATAEVLATPLADDQMVRVGGRAPRAASKLQPDRAAAKQKSGTSRTSRREHDRNIAASRETVEP